MNTKEKRGRPARLPWDVFKAKDWQRKNDREILIVLEGKGHTTSVVNVHLKRERLKKQAAEGKLGSQYTPKTFTYTGKKWKRVA